MRFVARRSRRCTIYGRVQFPHDQLSCLSHNFSLPPGQSILGWLLKSVLGWPLIAAPDSETAGITAFADCVCFWEPEEKEGGPLGVSPNKVD